MLTDDYLTVGKIITTHGLKGEVKVYPETDSFEVFKSLKEVVIKDRDGNAPRQIKKAVRFKNVAIVAFSGIDDVETAKRYVNCEILSSREALPKLKENSYYEADLLGMRVYDDSKGDLGTLTDIIHTGANDVYEISRPDGQKTLIPAIRSCVLDVDTAGKSMRVQLPEGL